MNTRPIITERQYISKPPQPWDWSAERDQWDLGDRIGHGSTEAEAVNDLLEQEENE